MRKQEGTPTPTVGLDPTTHALLTELAGHTTLPFLLREERKYRWHDHQDRAGAAGLLAGEEAPTAKQDLTQVSWSAGGSGTLPARIPRRDSAAKPTCRNAPPAGNLCLPASCRSQSPPNIPKATGLTESFVHPLNTYCKYLLAKQQLTKWIF